MVSEVLEVAWPGRGRGRGCEEGEEGVDRVEVVGEALMVEAVNSAVLLAVPVWPLGSVMVTVTG